MASKTNSKASHAAKRLARLAAVQALYQNAFEQQPLNQIIRDSLDQEFATLFDDVDVGEKGSAIPDKELFREIAEGAAAHKDELDAMIAGSLDKKLSAGRLDILLKAILTAGTFELYRHAKIPVGVIINDYVDVTRAFFNGKEPGLVNGVLDKLAAQLRKS
jgi:transcription antitermination protein NusB